MSCPTDIFCQFYVIQDRNFYIVLQLKKSEAVRLTVPNTIMFTFPYSYPPGTVCI